MAPGSLIIRADATRTIGAGHVMRCLALAEAWLSRGGCATILGVCEISPLLQRMRSVGVTFVDIESTHPAPSDVDMTVSLLRSSLDNDSAHWLVVDGYHFDRKYQEAVRVAGIPVLVVDDTAHLPGYCADLLVNQNVYAKTLAYRCDARSLLLGCRNVMLRKEFLDWRNWDREIPDVARRVLVSVGGSDPNNLTSLAVDALLRIDSLEFEAIVVSSEYHHRFEALKATARISDERCGLIQVVSYTSEMPKLMAWADVAITAGGTTCLESSFMGLPSVVVVTADNQARSAADLAKRGIIVNLGAIGDVESGRMAREIRALVEDPHSRSQMSEKGRKLVDGYGSSRVVDRMLAFSRRNQGVHSDSAGAW